MKLSINNDRSGFRVVIWVLSAIFLAVLLRTAWIADDAYISYRCVDNFINGHGLTFNPGQRVQAFTNALWAFLHIPFFAIFKNAYAVGLTLSIVFSSLAMILLLRSCTKENATRLLLLIAAISSSAFIDFSTSGLENPLTNVLLILIILNIYADRRSNFNVIKVALLISFLLLSRMDAFLLIAPIFMIFWKQTGYFSSLKYILLGLLPIILWEIFATYYYGFPFPMSAYAKLNTGIEKATLVIQGLHYLKESLISDPITLASIFTSITLPFILKKTKYIPLSIGLLIYLTYVVFIGGDFMSGRFFNTPFFMSLIVLSKTLNADEVLRGLPIVLVLAFLSKNPPILSHSGFGQRSQSSMASDRGIINERAYYFQGTGLISEGRRDGMPFNLIEKGKSLRVTNGKYYMSGILGYMGYYAGPQKHIIDPNALADPFLAQLPCLYSLAWRPGHNERLIPGGYIESLSQGKNNIEAEELRLLYDAIDLITIAPLNSKGRLKAIYDINFTNKFSKLLDSDFYRMPIAMKIKTTELPEMEKDTINIKSDKGLEIVFPQTTMIKKVVLDLQENCVYNCIYLDGENIVSSHLMSPQHSLQSFNTKELPSSPRPINRLLIYPSSTTHTCQIVNIKILQ